MKRVPVACYVCMALGLAAVWPVAAVDVVIHDADIAAAAVGDTLVIPVDVHGLEPSSFCAFELEFLVPPDTFALQAVERGGLIDAQDAGRAYRAASPYLWALAAHQDGTVLRVAGMILMDGVHVEQGNLGALNLARVPASQGELIRLRLGLLSTTPAVIALASSSANLLIGDALVEGSTPAVGTPAGSMAGGTSAAGEVPNDWEYRYFGLTGTTPGADPDGDRRANLVEFQDGTDPRHPDVRVRLQAGWNLISLPVHPADPAIAAVLSSANRGGAAQRDSGTPVYEGAVWGWATAPGGGHYVKVFSLRAFAAYWVYAPAAADLVVPGALPGETAIAVEAGWNLIGPLGTVSRADCGATVAGGFWGMDGATQQYVPSLLMRPGWGYWVCCPAAGRLEVDPVVDP